MLVNSMMKLIDGKVHVVIALADEANGEQDIWIIGIYTNIDDAFKYSNKANVWVNNNRNNLDSKSPYDSQLNLCIDKHIAYYIIECSFYRSFEEYGLLHAAGKKY